MKSMRKFFLLLICFICAFSMESCFIFKKKDKYGCPANGRNIGAEKLAQGDDQSLKSSKKSKYRGGTKGF